jgi:Chaperone for flagella basal body P-ring formation
MITRIYFLFFSLWMTFPVWACEVHLPSHLVILSESADVVKAGTQTGCNELILKDLNETLKSVEGKITSFQLEELLKGKNHSVQIQPSFLHVQQIKNLIRESVMLPSGVQLQSTRVLNSSEILTLNYGEKMEVLCSSCQFSPGDSVNLIITGIDGTKRSVGLTADFKKMVKAFRVTSFHPAFSEISFTSLKEELVEAIPHTDLITDLDTLKFYKLNKPIRAGELLRRSDLNALSLVKAGLKTEVIIENALVKLKTSAISRSNGTLGDFVEVFHPQKNKKYLGKVIDINKVLVEL